MPHTQDVTDVQAYLEGERGELGSAHASNDAPCPQAPEHDANAMRWLYTKLAARATVPDHGDWLLDYSLASWIVLAAVGGIITQILIT